MDRRSFFELNGFFQINSSNYGRRVDLLRQAAGLCGEHGRSVSLSRMKSGKPAKSPLNSQSSDSTYSSIFPPPNGTPSTPSKPILSSWKLKRPLRADGSWTCDFRLARKRRFPPYLMMSRLCNPLHLIFHLPFLLSLKQETGHSSTNNKVLR